MNTKLMNTKYNVFFYIFGIAITIFILLLLVYMFMDDRIGDANATYNLHTDGFVVIKNALNKEEIQTITQNCVNNEYYTAKQSLINNDKLTKKVIDTIGNQKYIFQDYIWIIKKSSVHTCHRDNNGDFFNEGQKYPSYTLLIYLENMDKCLGVIPSSHSNINSYNVNLNNAVINLPCNSGDAILFNANLIHVGTLNAKENNLRVQMKFTHIEDIQTISYYQNFNKVLHKDNNLPFIVKKIQKNFSCMFPIMSNFTQNENIKSARGTDNGATVGIFQKIFSYLFYGDSDFYDLPNAF